MRCARFLSISTIEFEWLDSKWLYFVYTLFHFPNIGPKDDEYSRERNRIAVEGSTMKSYKKFHCFQSHPGIATQGIWY